MGSELIGQPFSRPEYFHPRPSAAGAGYDAAASAGTNKGPTDRKLADTLIAGARRARGARRTGPSAGKIPADMVTASASRPRPAHLARPTPSYQVARVARARGTAPRTRCARWSHGTPRGGSSGFLGEPRVNVLLLNLALDAAARLHARSRARRRVASMPAMTALRAPIPTRSSGGVQARGGPGAARPAQGLLRRRARRRQDLRHARGGARASGPRAWTSWSASSRRTAAPRPRALLEGLEVLPRRAVEYRGRRLEEFDLDAALARRPRPAPGRRAGAHQRAGSRHAKRWQDVEELLDAGIDVYTTLNVQHLESLNDVVAQITGVPVRETVPDSVLERADEVELVDLPPDELLAAAARGQGLRARAGRSARSTGFFRKGNLIALRELALRRTAERVDAQMRGYMAEHGIGETWAAAERLLVCVGPEPARRPAGPRGRGAWRTRLHADWFAVYVETPRSQRLTPPSERERVLARARARRAARRPAVTLSAASSVADEILALRARRTTSPASWSASRASAAGAIGFGARCSTRWSGGAAPSTCSRSPARRTASQPRPCPPAAAPSAASMLAPRRGRAGADRASGSPCAPPDAS